MSLQKPLSKYSFCMKSLQLKFEDIFCPFLYSRISTRDSDNVFFDVVQSLTLETIG